MKVSILGFIIGLIGQTAVAQTIPDSLPRRGYFGVALEQSSSGPRVTGVTPGSTAAAAGIATGDLIIAIDSRDAATTDAVVSSLGRHHGGDSVSIRIQQDGKSRIGAS